MLKNLLEFLIKVLFDFSYERDLQEALVFYFFYLLFESYIVIGICFSGLDNNSSDSINLLTVIPFIFCLGIAVSFMFKKNLKDPFSIFLVALTMLLTLLFPNILGFYIGLIPISILSTREDNTEDKTD